MAKPKISLNKLGEYLDATPSRRRRIIQDQQNPEPFIITRYQDARESIIDFISGGMVDDARLLEAAQELREDHDGTAFSQQDKRASADAMEQFLDIADNIDIDGLIVEKVDKTQSSIMEVAGVDVSIRPDTILKDEKTGQIRGAIKLHFSKTHPLNEKSAGYVATTMKVYLELENENTESTIDPKKCYVIDIPTAKATTASKAHKKKMSDVEAACEEIDARWKKEES